MRILIDHACMPIIDPLLRDPTYGEDVAFYDEPTEKEVTSAGALINFRNGIEVTVPEGVVPTNSSIVFSAQPAFASNDVFKLPPGVEPASPTYLLSSSQGLNGNMTLKVQHFVKVRTEDDAGILVFLTADSRPSKDSNYHFNQVDSGDPSFKPGNKVGTISTNQSGFWKIGKRIGTCIYTYQFSMMHQEHYIYNRWYYLQIRPTNI